MANIELPRDAEGREIPLDTKILYDKDENEYGVYYYKYSVCQTIPQHKWQVVMTDYIVRDCSDLYIAPPDSWEKLEEKLNRCIEKDEVCCYYSENGNCRSCPISGNNPNGCISEVFKDIKKRIRKLRGEDK